MPVRYNGRGLAGFHLRQVLLGDLPAHLNLAATGDAEQDLTTRVCDLTGLGLARQHPCPSTGAAMRVRARRACASASCAATTLTFAASVTAVARRFSTVFRGQSACGFDSLGAPVLGSRQRRLGACLLERSRETVDLLHQDRVVDLRQQLATLDVVAGLDVHGQDPPGIALVGDRHVVARRKLHP